MLAFAVILVLAPMTCLAGDMAKPAATVSPSFDALKKLVGQWQEVGKTEKGTVINYELVAAGTALLERMDPGTDHSMATVYYPIGNMVMMTHYCAEGNQPRMRGEGDAKSINFTMMDITNLTTEAGPHMDGLKLTFMDKDHMVQEWRHMNGGKVEVYKFEMERKKTS